MPKPTPPATTATDLATAIQIGKLATEVSNLKTSKVNRSTDEQARITDQENQRREAQLYLYRSLSQAKAVTAFANPEKNLVRGLINTEATRLAALLPKWITSNNTASLPPYAEVTARIKNLTALSAAI